MQTWLYELQRHYYLRYGILEGWIPDEYHMEAYHLNTRTKERYNIIDLVQTIFECCGVNEGFTDWHEDHIYRPKEHSYRRAMG